MCGIAGILSLDGILRKNTRALHRMADCMHNRGPDDEGYFISSHGQEQFQFFGGEDTPSNDESISFYPKDRIVTAYDVAGSIFFAHRRLAIIDLSLHGHQPMCTADGRYWIIYNGEIYNYREIREDLKKAGVQFNGYSDTEVLLYAYCEWGTEALQRLNGMFAFAIWDDRDKVLFCARDRIGIKPFYYTIQDNQFVFASDIKTLIAGSLYKPEVDLEGLYHAMSFGVAPRPMTAFKGVRALEQGHWMRIGAGGGIEKGQYWRIPVGTQDERMSEDEAVELLECKLRQAIERRLIADVPVGTFMSGGIDSTTVSAIASGLHPGIKAFTLSFDNVKKLDELDQAKATAAMHPMEHITKSVKPESVLGFIEDIIDCYEEPFYDLSPNYVLCKFVAENNITVILNGLGGDELFAGYVYYGWLGRWRLLRKIKPLLRVSKMIPYTRHISERLLAVASTQKPDMFPTTVRSFITDMEKHRLFLDQHVLEYNTVERIRQLYVGSGLEFTDDLEAVSYADMMNNIGNHHVYRVDKFTMRFSIEGRLPFLDHEVVEAAYHIPSRYKICSKKLKYVLRKMAEKYIHPSCFSMKKKGFDLPTDQWMRGPLRDIVYQNLERLLKRDIFNPREVWQIYSEWRSRRRMFRSVWQLVSTEMWLKAFID
jgi:asparagine synthase (glutamine-hydrolysing)